MFLSVDARAPFQTCWIIFSGTKAQKCAHMPWPTLNKSSIHTVNVFPSERRVDPAGTTSVIQRANLGPESLEVFPRVTQLESNKDGTRIGPLLLFITLPFSLNVIKNSRSHHKTKELELGL